jgi:hypothetical protein
MRIIRIKQSKAVLVTGREGLLGCEKSKLAYFLDNRLTDGGVEVVSLKRRPRFTAPGIFLLLISVSG